MPQKKDSVCSPLTTKIQRREALLSTFLLLKFCYLCVAAFSISFFSVQKTVNKQTFFVFYEFSEGSHCHLLISFFLSYLPNISRLALLGYVTIRGYMEILMSTLLCKVPIHRKNGKPILRFL